MKTWSIEFVNLKGGSAKIANQQELYNKESRIELNLTWKRWKQNQWWEDTPTKKMRRSIIMLRMVYKN